MTYTIMKQEPFGPLVPMLSFKSFNEVIERANDNDLRSYAVMFVLIQWTIAHLASELIRSRHLPSS